MLPYFPLLMATKNGNIFPPPQNRRFLKNFSTCLQQASCQIHLNHTGVCLWCFVKPPKGNTVCSFGGYHVWWTHTNTWRVCVHASETPFTKGVFLCGVHRTWCACGGSLWQHDCCHRVVHRKHVCVCGGVWSLSVQHSTLVGSVFPW